MPAADADLSGTRFGGYDLLALIGRGGMGLVYRARQRNLDREVALKVLAPKLAANRKFIQRFVREARAAGRLSHPNVVQGFDVGEIDGRYFFAMELVDGETLLERLRRTGPISEALARTVLRKVADALAHAARHGITHRDIKPDNILLGQDGEPKLADLGLAKVERRASDDDDAPDRPASDAESHGTEGMVLGTAAYISPEQVLAKKGVDVRSDLYSLGMSCFHLLTGELPFPRRSRTEMLAAHLESPMPDVRARAPKVSDGMAALLAKLGEKDPDERPQTPEEVIEAVDAIDRGEPMPWETAEGIDRRRRIIARRRRRKAVSQGGVALGVVVLIGIGIALAVPRGGRPDPGRRRPRRPRATHPTATATRAPDPEPESEPPPPPPPPDRSALDTAQAWIQAHPDDLPGGIAQLRAAAAASTGDVRVEAERALARLEAAQAEAVAAANAELAREVAALIDGDQLAQAAARLAAAPADWREGATGRALNDRLADAAASAFEGVRRAVDDAQQDQDWAAAEAALAPALEWGVPAVVERARTLIATVQRLAADWEGLKRESRELAVVRSAGLALRDLLARRDLAGADARLAEVAVTATRAREVLADEAAAVADAQACSAALAESKRLLRGTALAIGGVKGEVVRIEGGTVVLTLRSGGFERALADLDAPTWLDLARRALDAGATPGEGVAGNPRAGWVVLALAAGDAEAARGAFEAGEWELDVHYRLQTRLELAPKLEREVAAFGLLADAEAAVKAGQWARAAEVIERAEFEFNDTEAVQTAVVRRRDIHRGVERLQNAGAPADPEPKTPATGGHELPGGG